MGIRASSKLRDDLRRRCESHPQRPARVAAARWAPDRSRATFSFNQATGARTAAKVSASARDHQRRIGDGPRGGVCQVSTTVFNSAYEAAEDHLTHEPRLYISHYRSAAMRRELPDVDLRFVNDTSHWLLLRTFVGSTR